MPSPLSTDHPERVATGVGLFTAVIGIALLAAPETVGGRAWIADPRVARAVGLVDLTLAPGLVTGRPRSPWMAARVVANLGTAALFARIARRADAPLGPATVAGALLAVSAIDVTVVQALRAAERA